MWIIVIIVYLILSIYDLVPLYKQKLRSDFWLNTALTVISFVFILLLSFNIKIPSPEKPIREFITSIFGK